MLRVRSLPAFNIPWLVRLLLVVICKSFSAITAPELLNSAESIERLLALMMAPEVRVFLFAASSDLSDSER